MPVLRLLRATKNNNILTRLRAEWDAELAASEDAPPIDVYEPMMAHADAIVATRDEDARYGIFAVAHCEDGCDTDGPPYEAFVHIGHKLPNTTDATLKVLWNLFAPRYQAGDLSPADMARIMTAIVSGAFELSKSHMPARQIKMYLGNTIDREYATTAAAFLATIDSSISFAVRSNWLHIQAA